MFLLFSLQHELLKSSVFLATLEDVVAKKRNRKEMESLLATLLKTNLEHRKKTLIGNMSTPRKRYRKHDPKDVAIWVDMLRGANGHKKRTVAKKS